MKKETRITFVAFDGNGFSKETECQAYERANAIDRLASLLGMHRMLISSGVDGENPDIGEALEHVGDLACDARLARGGHKKRRKEAPTAPEREAAMPPTFDEGMRFLEQEHTND